jgi:hypothetical protein
MDLGNDLLALGIQAVRDYLASHKHDSLKPGWLGGLLAKKFGFTPERPPKLLESDIGLWETIAARYHKFGSLVEDILGIPNEAIEELVSLLPEPISYKQAGPLLGKDRTAMRRDYTLPHPDEGGYRIKSAALFFYKENRIGRTLERIFTEADRRLKSGDLAENSPAYDKYRIEVGKLLEQLQDTIRDDFQVSNSQLDLLLDTAKRGPGYLGGKLTGAGSGGCVSILVREGCEEDFCLYLDREYYGKPENFDHYRSVLDGLESDNPPDSATHQAAREMKRNLEHALGNLPDCRRPVSFSRGACVVELDRFA